MIRCTILVALGLCRLAAAPGEPQSQILTCANLVYAGDKRSKCFSDRFLSQLRQKTKLRAARHFSEVQLGSSELFSHPFAIITGEGDFHLHEEERTNLRKYLLKGGFLLASAGCSSKPWDGSFRRELKELFPRRSLQRIPKGHPVFSTVYRIEELRLKKGGEGKLEGLTIDDRLVLIYSSEGLNDTRNTKGCCCCGGNEIRQSEYVNTNIFAYAVLE